MQRMRRKGQLLKYERPLLLGERSFDVVYLVRSVTVKQI